MRKLSNKSNVKNNRLGIMLLVFSLLLIGGSTFAFFTYRLNGTNTINFGKIQISSDSDKTHIVLKQPLNSLVPGDNLLDSPIHFKVDKDSQELYVRVRFYFSTTNEDVEPYVTLLNEMDQSKWNITTASASYEWKEGAHNFYYLVKKVGNTITDDMFNITKDLISSDTDFIFATQLIIPTSLTQIYDSNGNLVQFNKDITCHFAVDAVQSANYVGEVDGTSANITNLSFTLNSTYNKEFIKYYTFQDYDNSVISRHFATVNYEITDLPNTTQITSDSKILYFQG
jgi:predicted ribosomally synthesized peptide with SipW-like signal peptide